MKKKRNIFIESGAISQKEIQAYLNGEEKRKVNMVFINQNMDLQLKLDAGQT